MSEEQQFVITVIDVDEQQNKTLIDIDFSDEFFDWFLKTYNPNAKKLNKRVFAAWMKKILRKALITLEKGEHETIYSRMESPVIGKCDPQEGDTIVFFKNGYRTGIVKSVTREGVKLEELFEGDRYKKATLQEIHEIIRPRKKRVRRKSK